MNAPPSFLDGLPAFALLVAFATGTYALPSPLPWACLAGIGVLALVTLPVGGR